MSSLVGRFPVHGMVEEYPGDAEAHYMLGVIYFQTNDPARSENHFKKAIKRSPRSAMALCGLATVYRSSKPEEAAKLYLEAYRINPGLLDAYYEYAVILYKQNLHLKRIVSGRKELAFNAVKFFIFNGFKIGV